jgi:hypothetical protein
MKKLVLDPKQVITLNDYPLYSYTVFKAYYKKCITDEDLAFIPVIHKNIVRKYFNTELSAIFREFETQNPAAVYFMLDGSHRTTALTLADRTIVSIVYETDEDICEAKKLVITGKVLQNGTLDHTLEENCRILHNYFTEKPYFMTVQQKTDKLIFDNLISAQELTSLA